MFKRRRIRFLKKMQQRYLQEVEQKRYELDYSAYLLSVPERKQIEIEKRELESKVAALEIVINDLYIQVNGKVTLD